MQNAVIRRRRKRKRRRTAKSKLIIIIYMLSIVDYVMSHSYRICKKALHNNCRSDHECNVTEVEEKPTETSEHEKPVKDNADNCEGEDGSKKKKKEEEK